MPLVYAYSPCMYEEVKKISFLLYLSAVSPSASVHVSAEIVPLLLFCVSLRRDTYGKQVVGEQQHERVVVCEPLVSDHSTAGSVRSCARRGRTVPGLSQGQCSLTLAPTCIQMARCPGWGWPAHLVLGEHKPFPPPGMPCGQYTCPGVSRSGIQFTGFLCLYFAGIRVEHTGRCSECFLHFPAS